MKQTTILLCCILEWHLPLLICPSLLHLKLQVFPEWPDVSALCFIAGGERAHVGIATFDSTVHFYPMRQQQEQAQMLVVPDVTDVYCPLPQGLMVPIGHARPMVSFGGACCKTAMFDDAVDDVHFAASF